MLKIELIIALFPDNKTHIFKYIKSHDVMHALT